MGLAITVQSALAWHPAGGVLPHTLLGLTPALLQPAVFEAVHATTQLLGV